MLEALSAKLDDILKRLRGHGVLTEATIAEALKGMSTSKSSRSLSSASESRRSARRCSRA